MKNPQADLFFTMLEPYLDALADKIVDRLNHKQAEEHDDLLSPEQAADFIGGSPEDQPKRVRWLYRHADKIPGTKRLSRKCVRFSEKGLKRWLAAKGKGLVAPRSCV
jgi:hypothetical protein